MSSNVKSAPFKVWHLMELPAKPKVFPDATEAKKRILLMQGVEECHTRTIAADGIPIAVVGLTHIWKGYAEVWSITSDNVRFYPKGFHKAVLNLLLEFEKHLQIHRFQMTVREDYPEGHRWAESLGFQREGLMRGYGPDGHNAYLYARVK